MREISRRAASDRPTHLLRRPRPLARGEEFARSPLDGPLNGGRYDVTRRARAVRRGVAILLWTFPCMLVQAFCLLLPNQPKVVFPRIYWAVFARLLGVRVRVIGALASHPRDGDPGHPTGRPVLFVSNHSSWVDIPVLGGVLDAAFVAKGEVGTWPLISTIARLGRTVFVSRQRGSTARERDTMRGRFELGYNLILFPEGTSSDGSRVLPFRSAFFAAAEAPPGGQPPLIQPISVVYDRIGGLPAGRASRPVCAWYGDMDIATHFWRLAQQSGLRATVLLHAPLDPARFANRKALSQAVWRTVADGASTLRQNRPAQPLAVAEAIDVTGHEPAYA